MIDRMHQDQRLVSPGTLLLAHPNLQDVNFRRSVILMLADSVEQGSMGVVLNDQTGSTLGAKDLEMLQSPLAQVPGGPVAQRQLLLLGEDPCVSRPLRRPTNSRGERIQSACVHGTCAGTRAIAV